MDGPKLTDPKLLQSLKKVVVSKVTKESVSGYLNTILLVGFVIFSIFFLLNCKAGVFKSIDIDPVPFNLATFNKV